MAERTTIRGRVGHADYAAGSKSERRIATLTTDDGTTFVLRRIGANPYAEGDDEWVDGATIEATGYVHRDTFLVESYVRGSRRQDRA